MSYRCCNACCNYNMCFYQCLLFVFDVGCQWHWSKITARVATMAWISGKHVTGDYAYKIVKWSHGDFMFDFLKCIFILFVIFYSKNLVVSWYFHSQAFGCCTKYMCDSKLLRSSNTSNINTLLVRTKSELSGWWYNILPTSKSMLLSITPRLYPHYGRIPWKGIWHPPYYTHPKVMSQLSF